MTAGSSITPVSVSFTGSVNGTLLQVTSVSSGSIELGAQISGPGIPAGSQIVTQLDGTPGGAGLYSLYASTGTVSSETMTETYGVLTVGSVTSGTVEVGAAGYRRWRGFAHGDRRQSERQRRRKHLACQQRPNGRGRKNDDDCDSPLRRQRVCHLAQPQITTISMSRRMAPSATITIHRLLSYMGGTAAAALGLTQESGAINSTPGGQLPPPSAFMNNLVQNENGQFGSFQTTLGLVAQEDPEYRDGLADWAQSTDGLYTLLNQTTTTSPAGSSAPTTDPAGTYSGPGASAPTPAAAGTYIPVTGATSESVEIGDPAGTYSVRRARARRPPIRPAHTAARARARPRRRTRAPIFHSLGRPPSQLRLATLPALTARRARARRPPIRPAHTAARTRARPRWRTPARIFLSWARPPLRRRLKTLRALTVRRARAGRQPIPPAPTAPPARALRPPIRLAPTAARARARRRSRRRALIFRSPERPRPRRKLCSPPGTYAPPGASAPIADPGGTYSAAGASAPTTDPAGTYSSPYALNRLFIEWKNNTPDNAVLSFHSATAVANYYGATSTEASLANEFFAGYGGTSATMLFTRMGIGRRPHLLGANIGNLTLSQLQSINGSLAITFQGYTYSGPINLSGVTSFSDGRGQRFRARSIRICRSRP